MFLALNICRIFIFCLFIFLGVGGGGWGKIRIMDPLQVTGSKAALNTSLHSKWMLVTEYQRRNSDPHLIGVPMISTAFICQSVCLHVSCQCSLKPVHSFLLFCMQLVRNSFFWRTLVQISEKSIQSDRKLRSFYVFFKNVIIAFCLE